MCLQVFIVAAIESPYSSLHHQHSFENFQRHSSTPFHSSASDSKLWSHRPDRRPHHPPAPPSSWSGAHRQSEAEVQGSMSNRPIESATTTGSSTEIKATASNSLQLSTSSPPSQSSIQATNRPFELPPLPSASQSRHGTFPAVPSQSSSFSNILNPSSHVEEQPHGRRRKASELSSPYQSRPRLPPLPAEGRQRSPSLSTIASPAFSPSLPHGRRILTPRSPALHRAASVGQLGPPTASLDSQVSSYPQSPRTRTYTVEPGRAGIPPLPAHALSARPSYAHSPSVARTRPARLPSGHGDDRPRSISLSPRSVYPTQFPSTHAPSRSDTLDVSSAVTPHLAQHYGPGSDQAETYGEPISDRSSGIPISSSGQNAFQMMTLQTTSGTVQLPVEVQAASRVADEKRRRNAGASARFRARRKEKEKESSVTIAKLEMQVKNLSEDVDFYRRERGYLAGIVLQVPGGERHFPRPTSPRHHRPAMSIQLGPSRSTSAGYVSDPNMPSSPGEGRNVRRRTSTISLPMQDSGTIAAPIAGPSAYTSARYDMAPMAGQHGQARPSLPGPAALLAPAPPQLPQYGVPSSSETSWSASGARAPPADPSRQQYP